MSEEGKELLIRARKAAENAYCPYSDFPVGAAVVASNGAIFMAANVENASYGLSICAERASIFAAVAAGERTLARLAVSCKNGNHGSPATLMPCGACRQVMAEFMSADSVIVVDGVGEFRLRDLLPEPFKLG